MVQEFVTLSAEETAMLGRRVGSGLGVGSVVCFFGDLAAGKTTFIKGVVEAAVGVSEVLVSSPTFVYLNVYGEERVVYHFDLYRLGDVEQFLSMGFEEYFFCGGICCIEWAERIESILPGTSLLVTMEHRGRNRRLVRLSGNVPGISDETDSC